MLNNLYKFGNSKSMINSKSDMKYQRKIEFLMYMLIWVIVFTIPVFSDTNEYGKDWNFIFFEWVRYIPLLLIFITNDLWLSKKYLLTNKYWKYVLYLIVTLAVFVFVSEFFRHINSTLLPFRGPEVHPMGSEGFRVPPEILHRNSPFRNITESIIISILVIGFNDSIKMMFSMHKNELEHKEEEKLHLETQLSFLRTQISPHFFMNTLNNIHALIDIDPEKAQNSIIKLSDLMRYLLKQSENGKNTIKKEFDFLKSYIALMSIRYSDKVTIETKFVLDNPEIEIPSLLFVSVVENAFKYGVSYAKDSFIEIKAFQTKNSLTFTTVNNKVEYKSAKSLDKIKCGVGLSNLKKQLDLLYPDKHILDIEDGHDKYKITIKIPI